jgi:hypothetical protein
VRPQIHPLRLVLKTVFAFAALSLAYAGARPPIGQLTVYNLLVPGLWRFPVQTGGTSEPFSIAAEDLQTLFSSHLIAKTPKAASEYRVLLLGDSQTWGASLASSETLGQQLNAAGLSACGKQLRFYNLAYPFPSVLKDFFILHESLQYKPDLVVWMLTAGSFLHNPASLGLVNDDPHPALALLHSYRLDKYRNLVGPEPSFLERTLTSQAGRLHKWARLQMYGPIWAATGSDLPWNVADFNSWISGLYPPETDSPANLDWNGYPPPTLPKTGLFFDVLPAARQMTDGVPVLIVTEPIFIAPGRNSNIRYNFMYPRWAYDEFRQALQDAASRLGWDYLDLHDLVPHTSFVDSTYHLMPAGEAQVARALTPEVLRSACP